MTASTRRRIAARADISAHCGNGHPPNPARGPADQVAFSSRREAGRMPTIGVLEDDEALRSVLRRALQAEDFDVREASTGRDAVRAFGAEPPDVLVLDVGLPDADGRDVCQALRTQGIASPVLFLTARDALTDRLSGFHAGGDDYLTKPFALAELLVRGHALGRRGADNGVQEPATGGLRLGPAAHAVARGEDSASLTPTEFRLR